MKAENEEFMRGLDQGIAFERHAVVTWLRERVTSKGWVNKKSTWLWLVAQIDAAVHYAPRPSVYPDSDKGANHSPVERFQTYSLGFRHGAASVIMMHPAYADYRRGYEDGRKAAGEARMRFAEEVGYDLCAGILREGQ